MSQKRPLKNLAEKQEPTVRVVKGNWETKETIFLSGPMTVEQALAKIKELVPSLPVRGEGRLLVKFHEDEGENFDYMKVGGWMIFTHREEVPW